MSDSIALIKEEDIPIENIERSRNDHTQPDDFDLEITSKLNDLKLNHGSRPDQIISTLVADTASNPDELDFWDAPFPPPTTTIFPADFDFAAALREQRRLALNLITLFTRQANQLVDSVPDDDWYIKNPKAVWEKGTQLLDAMDLSRHVCRLIIRRLEDFLVLVAAFNDTIKHGQTGTECPKDRVFSAEEREMALKEMYRVFLHCRAWLNFLAGTVGPQREKSPIESAQ